MNFLTRTGIAAAAALVLAAAPAYAATVKYHADLKGAEETPPNDSAGTGIVDASLDDASKTLTWTITYDGLTGDATAAHYHGPAKASEKAPPVVPLSGSLASPIAGSATLTDAQLADLQNGMLYFNLHTAKYPDGEIRGQVMPATP